MTGESKVTGGSRSTGGSRVKYGELGTGGSGTEMLRRESPKVWEGPPEVHGVRGMSVRYRNVRNRRVTTVDLK